MLMLVLSLFLLTNLGSLTSPSVSELGQGAKKKNPNGQQSGELTLRLEANITEHPGLNASFVDAPLDRVQVEVTNQENLSSHLSNYTNPNGFLNMSLPSSNYYISFNDWRLNNSQILVQIRTGIITLVNVYLNASVYNVQSFDIVDPESSGMAVGWENMYAQLANLDTVGNQGASTFLITKNFPSLVALDSTLPTGVTPVSIRLDSQSNSSQWLSLKVGSPISISSITNVDLLSLSSRFVVSTR